MPPQVPARPLELLRTSRKNWNRSYGKYVRLERWTYEKRIRTTRQAAELRKTMTADDVWFPSWQASEPHKMRVLRVRDDIDVKPARLRAWRAYVRKIVKVGQHVLTVRWRTTRGRIFTTTCVVDKHSIVYDSLLSNAVMVDTHSRCFDYHIGWLWQTKFEDMTRGHIWADCIPVCRSNGTLLKCTENCGGDMSLGGATCKATRPARRIPGSECCFLSYSWGWGTPLIDVKVTGKGKYGSVSVSGSLGSKGSGAASCVCCCPGLPAGSGAAAAPTPGTGKKHRPRDDDDENDGEDCELEEELTLDIEGPKNGQLNFNYEVSVNGELLAEDNDYANLNRAGRRKHKFNLADICVPHGCEGGFTLEVKFHFSALDENDIEVYSQDFTISRYVAGCNGSHEEVFAIGEGKVSIAGKLELLELECADCE